MTLRAMNPAATATRPMTTRRTLKPVDSPPDFEPLEPGAIAPLLTAVVEVVEEDDGVVDDVVLLGADVVGTGTCRTPPCCVWVVVVVVDSVVVGASVVVVVDSVVVGASVVVVVVVDSVVVVSSARTTEPAPIAGSARAVTARITSSNARRHTPRAPWRCSIRVRARTGTRGTIAGPSVVDP
jgi:hypothetical protein